MFNWLKKLLGMHIHDFKYSYYSKKSKRFYYNGREYGFTRTYQVKTCSSCGFKKEIIFKEVDTY